jgi:DNA-binding response OmpR family regulator
MNTTDEILVVDDAPGSLSLLEGILVGAGYQVRLAIDGELALRSAKIQPPGLVLLDIRMPGMDGYEVCQRLKEDEKTRSVPIIFLSILENEHEKVKAFQVGGVDYITKPIRAAEVLARVHTQLSLRHAQMDLEARNVELEAARETLEERVAERSVELEQINRKLQQQIDSHLYTLEALRESEAKYRSLIRKVRTAIVLYDGRGQLLNSNPLAHELFGLSEDQLLGKSLNDPQWRFLREDGGIMSVAEYPVSIVLSSQRALRGYVTGIRRPDKDDISWVLVNAEPNTTILAK